MALVLVKRRDDISLRMVLDALTHGELHRLYFYDLKYENFFFYVSQLNSARSKRKPNTVNHLKNATGRKEVLSKRRQSVAI